MSDTFVMIYTTFPGKAEAKKCGRDLVARKLAACVNIFPRATAIFEWEGEIQTAREAAMIIKTRAALKDAVYAALKESHPYALPAFLVYEASGGSDEFLAWIAAQTASV
ncbi:MAG: divalent-cation tolerance protein CutA [Hyphomicrobiales bacterium]|nr:divalent-cation tolerance protein CutA [Hyphomicrobiales bacterium]